jgi:hypothetical protein
LLLFVPALPWLFGSLDEVVQHRRRYTRAALRTLMSSAELAIEELTYFDLAGVIPWFVAARILRLRTVTGPTARLYDRLVVPVGERLERHAKPPIGKNLLCVAVKPRGD